MAFPTPPIPASSLSRGRELLPRLRLHPRREPGREKSPSSRSGPPLAPPTAQQVGVVPAEYEDLLSRVSALLEQGRRATVRTTNAILTATYWQIGRQIVEYEQGGKARAEYGEVLLK